MRDQSGKSLYLVYEESTRDKGWCQRTFGVV